MTESQLLVGTRPGRSDLAKSPSLATGDTTFVAQGLPTDGRKLYVRLRYKILGKWRFTDHVLPVVEP